MKHNNYGYIYIEYIRTCVTQTIPYKEIYLIPIQGASYSHNGRAIGHLIRIT